MKTITDVIRAHLKDRGISIAHIARKLYGDERGKNHSVYTNLRQKLHSSDISMQLVIDISEKTGENLLEVVNQAFIVKKKKQANYEKREELSLDKVLEEKMEIYLKKHRA